jgi:Ni/Co efflux regulator RcnB
MYKKLVLFYVIVAIFGVTGLAQAEKPSWAGGGKGEKQEQKKQSEGGKGQDGGKATSYQSYDVRVNVFFGNQQRDVIRNYYSREYRSGHCPPGLAKKNNGCMPPGQAKKWQIGRPLPHDVVSYELPADIIVQLGTPPAGHRFVRVASDILLMAVGTGMVVDAIQDLSSM